MARGLFVGIPGTAQFHIFVPFRAFVGIRCLNAGAHGGVLLRALLNGVFAKTFDDISRCQPLLTPLTYLGRVFTTDFVAAVLARAVAPEPNRLYDQWFPLRLLGIQ